MSHKRKFDASISHKRHYPFFEMVFFRPVSRKITPIFAKIGLKPNFVTCLSLIIGLGGIILVALGNYWWRVVGAGILLISFIFDCVDGELARGFKIQSKFGAMLDTTFDSIQESLILFALAWTYFISSSDYKILFYLSLALLLQRLLGRTIPWYILNFGQNVEQIKNDTLNKKSKLFKAIGLFFSESYRSSTIWIVVMIGVVSNQIKLTFIYFITVMFILLIFLLIKALSEKGIEKEVI